MIKAGIFFIIIILMVQTAGAQAVITNEKSIFTIDVLENGNALWSEEKRYPLASQSAISEWKLKLKDMSNVSNISNVSNVSTKKGTEIDERINRSLLSAMNYSNRSMSIQNFNITYDLVDEESNAYGLIRWNFEWVNFSQMEGSNIIIGDAFSDRVAPSLDNVLIINIPEGYEIVNASPWFDKRDGNKLIWDGTMYRSFSKGEPSLVLSRKLIAEDLSEDSYPTGIALISIIVGGSLLFLFMRWYFSKKKDGLMAEIKLYLEQVAAKDEAEVKPDEEEAVQSGANSDLPPITEDILGYEEMIERYLIKCGGQAYQSDIVNESGLSKSKISIVLSTMKDEGRILKIRKGKENVIRLAKKE